MNKPWFRNGKGWYLTSGKRQIFLAKDEAVAYQKWHELLAAKDRQETKNPTLQELFGHFTRYAERQVKNDELKQSTLSDYQSYIERFMKTHGEMQVKSLEIYHVTDWIIEQKKWGPSSERNAITALKRLLSWAHSQGRISHNPLEPMRKPPRRGRTRMVQDDQHERFVFAIRNGGCASPQDKQFQLVLIALQHCGGRPQDVSNVRVEHVSADCSYWTLPDHKRYRHTRQPKTVYLSPCLQTITRIVVKGRKSGPLFRGRRGTLTVNAIGCRIKRIQKSLGFPVIAYDYRHTYITRALMRGVEVATVAELAGTSIQMIERHYGHLAQCREHLKKAAAQAMTDTSPMDIRI